jgi:glycerophosphoryl diester phosphodiesterase
MLCISHRGAMGHAPENTLLSVQKALALGTPWIEVDVYAVEGQLVVIHDPRLERTTNGKGYVVEQTLAYLRSLDAGQGQAIPTLAEVFDRVDRQAGINIELKGADTAAPVAGLIKNSIARGWSYEQILVSSFNHPELYKLKELDRRIRIGVLLYGVPLHYAACAEELGAFAIHLAIDFSTRELVEDARRRGLKVFVYTVNHPEDIARMRKLGVDGIITDFPERVIS